MLTARTKAFVQYISASEHRFLIIATLFLIGALPVIIFAILQTRDLRSLATHQECFDITGDFRVTQADPDTILNHSASGGGYVASYDVNHDGQVNPVDAQILLQHNGEICTPSISFSASPASISNGASSTLNWNVKYSNSVNISPPVGLVGSSGSRSVSPSSSSTYTLTASNNWATRQKSVSVTVHGTGPAPAPPAPSDPSSTSQPSSGNSSSSSTFAVDPDILKTIKFKINAPYLVGNIKIPLAISGRNKQIEISGGEKTYAYSVSKDRFRLNRRLEIVIGGSGVVRKNIQITPKKETVNVSVGTLLFGDLNNNNSISNDDKSILIEAVANQTSAGDLNADGISNSLDWAIMMTNLTKTSKL